MVKLICDYKLTIILDGVEIQWKRSMNLIWYFKLRCVIWTTIYVTIFGTTINLQRKLGIDMETKTIERKSKIIIWV